MKIKLVFLILISIVSFETYSQDYLGRKRKFVKSEIKELFSNESKKMNISENIIKIDTVYRFAISDTELQKKITEYGKNYFDSLYKIPTVIDKIDTLSKIYVKINETEDISIEYNFNPNWEMQCDSIVMKFINKKNANKYIKSILDNNDRQWKKINSTSYISKFRTKSIYETNQYQLNPNSLVGSPKMEIKYPDKLTDNTIVIMFIPMMPLKIWNTLTK